MRKNVKKPSSSYERLKLKNKQLLSDIYEIIQNPKKPTTKIIIAKYLFQISIEETLTSGSPTQGRKYPDKTGLQKKIREKANKPK